MARIHYREQDLQIRCVKWFRTTYPAFSYLMFHPKNEEAGGRVRAAIAKAEGVKAGVGDLILLVPTQEYSFLVIELKTKTGRQSREQKMFQRYVEAAGGKYIVVRTFEGFCDYVTNYMDDVTPILWGDVHSIFNAIEEEAKEEAKRELEKFLNKQ